MSKARVHGRSGTEETRNTGWSSAGTRRATHHRITRSGTARRRVFSWIVILWAGLGSCFAAVSRADDPPEVAGGSRQARALGLSEPVLRPRLMTLTDSTVIGSRDLWSVGALNPDHDDHYVYRLPYDDKVSYAVLQGYGSKLSHQGAEYFTVDFRMPEGTPIHAAREGRVALVEEANEGGCWTEGCGALANYVVVLHPDGTTGEYFHLRKNGVLVEPGQWVERGQPIAVSGNTGYSTTPHLHFGVYGQQAWGRAQSIDVRFQTRAGVIEGPRPGARYLNVNR